jgi:hypothetical protein
LPVDGRRWGGGRHASSAINAAARAAWIDPSVALAHAPACSAFSARKDASTRANAPLPLSRS